MHTLYCIVKVRQFSGKASGGQHLGLKWRIQKMANFVGENLDPIL